MYRLAPDEIKLKSPRWARATSGRWRKWLVVLFVASCTCFDHLRGTYNLLSSSSAVLHKIFQLAFHSKLLWLLHLSCTKITPACFLPFETLVSCDRSSKRYDAPPSVVILHYFFLTSNQPIVTAQCALHCSQMGILLWAKNGLVQCHNNCSFYNSNYTSASLFSRQFNLNKSLFLWV